MAVFTYAAVCTADAIFLLGKFALKYGMIFKDTEIRIKPSR